MSERLKQESFHQLIADKGGAPHNYRVTHYVDADDRPTGKGFVEVEDTIDLGDGETEIKFRRTGASYTAFCEMLQAKYEADKQREEHEEAMKALDERRRALAGINVLAPEPQPETPPEPVAEVDPEADQEVGEQDQEVE